jgi:diphthamide biosynthesis methyltransferase
VVKISEIFFYGCHPQHHTYINFIDIRVKEPTLESLTKKKKEYQPPRFMSINEAAEQLLEIIGRKHRDHEELGMLQTTSALPTIYSSHYQLNFCFF